MFNYHVHKIQSLVPILNEFIFYFVPFASGLTTLTFAPRSSKRALPSGCKTNIFYALLISHLQAANSSQPIFLYLNFILTDGGEYTILCFVDRASLYNLFQMKLTSCTLLFSIFISTSLHISGNYVPIIRRSYCMYATLVFFTLYGWLSGQQKPPILLTTEPPIQSEKYQCRIDIVSYPDDGHIVARNM